jgi:RNA polymerase sigma-70 factor (ECF subfamily)
MSDDPGEITKLLRRWQTGDKEAEALLFALLMPDLRKIARYCFRGERPGHLLQPTVLVNEAFLRLVKVRKIEWADRGHFLALAARIMRRYLIDHARSQPNVMFLPMDGLPERILSSRKPVDLAIAIDALLDELEAESRQKCAVVELKFFMGLTDPEAAAALNMELRTLQREWHRARTWLFQRLSSEKCKTAPSATNS